MSKRLVIGTFDPKKHKDSNTCLICGHRIPTPKGVGVTGVVIADRGDDLAYCGSCVLQLAAALMPVALNG